MDTWGTRRQGRQQTIWGLTDIVTVAVTVVVAVAVAVAVAVVW